MWTSYNVLADHSALGVHLKCVASKCAFSAWVKRNAKAQFKRLVEPGDRSRPHRRVRSGNIIWCVDCGSYAERYARGLKGNCEGHTGKGKKGKERRTTLS